MDEFLRRYHRTLRVLAGVLWAFLILILVLWFLTELEILDMPGLEPVSVFIGVLITGLGGLLSRLGGRRGAVLETARYKAKASRSSTVAQGNHAEAVGAGAVVEKVQGDKKTSGTDLSGSTFFAPVTINAPQAQTADSQPPAPTAAPTLVPYLTMLANGTRNLPLAAVDPTGENVAIDLGNVFINLDAGQIEKTRPGAQRGQFVHERTSAALAHLFYKKQLILLGDPGSGKSTLLRYLTHCLAQHALQPQGVWLQKLNWQTERLVTNEKQPQPAWQKADEKRRRDEDKSPVEVVESYWQGRAPVPVFIEMQAFARSSFDPESPLALWQYACGQLAARGLQNALPILERHLQQGELIFLLDGVDEVPVADRRRVWQAIGGMQNGVCAGNCWAATCRVLSFDRQEAPAGAPVETLQPLNRAQMQRFVTNWYDTLALLGSQDQTEAGRKAAQLQAALDERPRLRDLGTNPLLLTIMAVVQTYYGTLPDERAKLYQQCVETLLLRWQSHKDKSDAELPPDLAKLGVKQPDLERLLWEIAWQAHSKAPQAKEAAFLTEEEVIQIARGQLGDYTKAEAFVTYTEKRAHLLVGRGGKTQRVYSFPHRTFQEYLAACWLAVPRHFTRRAAELAARGDPWREVLNLAVGTLLFNNNNHETALEGIARVVPDVTPAADDASGWNRVWLAGEMTQVVGRAKTAQDEFGAVFLPRLCSQLAALVTAGLLTAPQRADAGAALGRLGDPRLVDVPEVVEVAAGPFLMGSDKAADGRAFGDEEPQHEQPMPERYAIGKYPVTVGQYGRFVEDGGYTEKWRNCWTNAGWRQREKEKWTAPRYWDDPQWTVPNHPVVGVSWYEAVAYCNWLKATTGRSFRLPDEAMWEKAARGTDGRIYPWGNKWDSDKLNAENKVGRTTAVGIFPTGKSPFGIYDASGNVWEWCSGLGYNQVSYPFKRQSYEEDMAVEGSRCLRGGAFSLDDQITRAAYRYNDYAHLRNLNIGFRVAEHLLDPES